MGWFGCNECKIVKKTTQWIQCHVVAPMQTKLSLIHSALKALNKADTLTHERLRTTNAKLDWLLMQHITPGPLTIEVTQMADSILFKVALPLWPETPADIVKGVLKISIDGAPATEQDVEKGATEVAGLSGPQDAEVSLVFVYVDDAGNESDPSTAIATLVDNVAPPAPGQLGIVVTGEESPAPTPDPDPNPDPNPDPDPGTPSDSASV